MDSASLRLASGHQSGDYDDVTENEQWVHLRGALGKADVEPDMLEKLRLALGDSRKNAADPRIAPGLCNSQKQGLESLVFAAGQLNHNSSQASDSQHLGLNWYNLHQVMRATSILQRGQKLARQTLPQQPRMCLRDAGHSVLASKRLKNKPIKSGQSQHTGQADIVIEHATASPKELPRIGLRNAGHTVLASKRLKNKPIKSGHTQHAGQAHVVIEHASASSKEFQSVSPQTAAEFPPRIKSYEHLNRDNDNACHKSSLSVEDRRRFGLDIEEVEHGEVTSTSGQSSSTAETPPPSSSPSLVVPRWSSLSAEDRRRFGLLEEAKSTSPHLSPESNFSADVLWGGHAASGIPGSGEAKSFHAPAPSMERTLAQLQAVGVTRPLPGLRSTENQLWAIKLQS